MANILTYTELEKKALQELKQLMQYYKPFVLFSGGRDSLVALHLAIRAADAANTKVTAVHVDTTVSTPGNLDYVKNTCKDFGVQLVVVRPKKDFFTLVKKWGFPTVTRRWCCYHLKIEPLKRFLLSVEDRKFVVDGIRKNESPRRREFPKIGYHKHFKCLNYHPIFDFSSENVKAYIKANRLKENPLYGIFPRATECWCTSFKTVTQFIELKKYFPDFFQKFVEAEASLKKGGSALFRNGRRIYLREL